MHEALLKRVQTALALSILDCNRDMTALLEEIKCALRPSLTHPTATVLAPIATLRDALELAELAWQIEAPGEAGETLNGLAFNLLPKLRALAPPGPPQQGGGGREEGEDFKAQLKRISTSAARREGMGEQVKACGLTADGNEAACGREVVIHQMTGGSADYLPDPTGNRRFWAVRRAVDSSGLTAESTEAGASSAMHSAAMDDATNGEPGAGA